VNCQVVRQVEACLSKNGSLRHRPVQHIAVTDIGVRNRVGLVRVGDVAIAVVVINTDYTVVISISLCVVPCPCVCQAGHLGTVEPLVKDVFVITTHHPLKATIALRHQANLHRLPFLLLIVEDDASVIFSVIRTVVVVVIVIRVAGVILFAINTTTEIGVLKLSVRHVVVLIDNVALECCRCKRYIGETKVSIQRNSRRVPVVNSDFIFESRDLVIAQSPVAVPDAVGNRVFADQAKQYRPFLVYCPKRVQATAVYVVLVEVVLDQVRVVVIAGKARAQDIIDVTPIVRGIADRANSEGITYRDIDKGAYVVAVVAAISVAVTGLNLTHKSTGIRFVGDIANGAAL